MPTPASRARLAAAPTSSVSKPHVSSSNGYTKERRWPHVDCCVVSESSLESSARRQVEALPKSRDEAMLDATLEARGTVSSASASVVTSTDVRRILIDFRHECAAATIRHEEFFKQVLLNQRDLHQRQDDLIAEFRCISKSLLKEAIAREVISDSEILSQIAADEAGKLCGHLDKDAEKVPKEVSNDEVESNSCPTVPARTETSRGQSSGRRSLAFETFESEDHGDQSFSARASRLLKRKEFEFVIAFALMCNCIVMSWEAQYEGLDVGFNLQYPGRLKPAHTIWAGAETTFQIFDWTFGMIFLLECLAKLTCWQLSYFCDYWNILDLVCVLASLFGKVAGAGFKPHMIRLLRLFRLARLVRLIRFLESLEALYVMTTAIAGMKRVLCWAIFLLTIMLLTCALFLVQLLQATYFSEASVIVMTNDQLEKHHKMYAYFGTCTRCMLSMFEITLGNWPPIARLLSEEVSEWFTVLCLLHKLTIGFAVVGVITGVILQETFKVAQTDDIIMLRQKRRASDVLRDKLANLFESLDKNSDEKVEFHEFQRICLDKNIKTWLASLDIETDDLLTLFHLVDVDSDGAISTDELLSRMPRIRGTARSIDVLSLLDKLKHNLK